MIFQTHQRTGDFTWKNRQRTDSSIEGSLIDSLSSLRTGVRYSNRFFGLLLRTMVMYKYELVWFLRTTCQVCAVHSWFFPSQMLCSCFVSNAFCQSFLCQCRSSAIYGFTTKSSSPIMILIACLLASFLIHTLGCFLFLPPFMSEWSVKSFHYACCHHGFQHWWGAPQECSIMWHSLVCPPPTP